MMTRVTHISRSTAAAAVLAAAFLSIAPVVAGTLSIAQHRTSHAATRGESTVYMALDESIGYNDLDATIVNKSPIRD